MSRCLALIVLSALLAQMAAAQGVCGSQVASATLTIATRVPASSSLVTVSFKIVTPLAINDLVTITYPSGFFVSGVSSAFTQSPASIFTTPASTGGTTIVVTAAAAAAAGIYTLTFAALTMGPATAGSTCGFFVSTSRVAVPLDMASAGGPTGSVGGMNGVPSLALTSMVASTATTFTVAFTTGSLLPSGGKITINFPANLFTFAGTLAVTGTISGTTTVTTTAATVSTQIVLTTGTADIAANTAVSVLFTNAWSTGVPQAASTFSVLTSMDLVSQGTTPVIGGQVGVGPTLAITTTLASTATTFTVAFKTGTLLPSGGKITINFPANLFTFAGTLAVTGTISGTTTVTTTAATVSTQIVLTTGTADIAANTAVSVLFTNAWSTGLPQAAFTPCLFSVSTSRDMAAVATASAPISGQISNVVLTIPTPATPTTASVFTVAFKTGTVNILALGQTITINLPANLFTFAGTLAVTGTISGTTTVTTTAATVSTQIVLTTGTADIAANTAVSVVFTNAWSLGAIQAANPAGITVSSSIDMLSAATATPKLGGQVTGVSLSIAAAARSPGLAAQLVTVSFITQTSLPVGAKVTINYPSGLLATNIATAFTQSPVSIFTTPAANTGASSFLVTVAAIAAPGTYTLTFTSLTMGPNMAAPCNIGIWVATDTDVRSTLGGAGVNIGGQVQNAMMTIAAADRVVGATGKSVTVSFTTQTALAASDVVNINYPLGFFLAGVATAFTQTPASIFTTPGATVGATSFAVTAAVAVPIGTYTLIFTAITMGSPPTIGTLGFSVSTTRDSQSMLTNTGFLGLQVRNAMMTIAAADRSPTAIGKAVTVSFTTQTALAASDVVTINYPLGFFLAGVATAFTQTPAAIFTTPGAIVGATTFTVTAAVAVPIGTYTLIFTAITMGSIFGPMCTPISCSSFNAFSVQTSKDYMSAMSTLGAIGGQVQNAMMTIAAVDRVAAATGKSVTVSFTTQTALAASDVVNINYPLGFFLGGVATAFTQTPAAIFTTPGATVGATTFTVTAAVAVPIGTYTLIFTAITMGTPMAPSTMFSVSTTRDCASAATTTGNIGGVVTAPTLSIDTADRVAVGSRKIVIGFTLASNLVSTGTADTITITFPSSFISGTPISPVTGSITPTAVAISGNQLVLTAAAAIAAGAQTITVCGLTLLNFPVSSNAVQVTSSKDYTSSCTSTLTVGPAPSTAVTAVSMTIPWASRSAGTAVTPLITFTTTTAIPAVTLATSGGCAAALNFISIAYPSSFFTATTVSPSCSAQPMFSVTGAPSGYTLRSYSSTEFVLTGSNAVPAATVIALTFGGVSLGVAYGGSDTGISVTTTMDTIAATAATGPISGYQVTAVSLPTCQSDANACQPFVITFNSLATVTATNTILITFSTLGNMPLSGAPDAFMSGGVLWTGIISANVLTLTADSRTGSFVPGTSPITWTLTGMKIASTPVSGNNYMVQMSASGLPSTNQYAGMLYPTGTITKTTSLTIDKPYPGVTGARATVSFTTSSNLVSGGAVYMSLPVGFFTAFSSVMSCTGSMPSGMFTATTATPCATLVASNIVTQTPAMGGKFDLITVTVTAGSLPAGANSFILSGVNLNAGSVAATTAFKVITSADVCSLGAVTTGSISNSNPGGSASSAASAVLCMALLLSSVLIMLL